MGETELMGGLPVVAEGVPPAYLTGGRSPDVHQDRVVDAPTDARFVVEAGPGFGKTDVACARVARLVDEEGVEPTSILLLSFTRTAVKEMRARIAALAADGAGVADVEIRTLDSFAWQLRTSLEGSDQDVVQSYEDSIALLADRLRDPSSELRDRLESYSHVFVDEAQDLHGPRVDLVVGLLSALPGDCGWTVFLDPAQAIYGWSEDEEEGTLDHRDLLERLPPFEPVQLQTLFRTRDPGLRRLLLGGRALVLDESISDRATRLRAVLDDRAEGTRKAMGYTIDDLRGLLGKDADDLFVLFRTRAGALDASSWLLGKKPAIPHRLRFGALPVTVSPWVALVVRGAFELAGGTVQVREEHLLEAFESISNPWMVRGWSAPQACAALRRIARSGGRRPIDLRRVADAIARRHYPDDLFHREVGSGGPIIGTVHGAKGREARRVVMTVAPPRDGMDEDAELGEARVLYVALSRAKEELRVRLVKRGPWGRLENGRVWQRRKAWRVEVGRDGDVDPALSLEGRGSEEVAAQQARVAAFDGQISDLNLFPDRERDWHWQLRLEDHEVIAEMSPGFKSDVWDVVQQGRWRKESRVRPHGQINYVRWFDVTTVALPRDHLALKQIPEPWKSLRCWLMPVVSGLGWFKTRVY